MLKRYLVTVLNFMPDTLGDRTRPALAQEAVVAVFAKSDDQARRLGVSAFQARQPFAIAGEQYEVTGIEEDTLWAQ